MSKTVKKALQNTLRNDLGTNLVAVNRKTESVATWIAAYFEFEVTTMASSQKVQQRDLASFLNFMLAEVGNDKLPNWTPRLSQAFKTWLQNETLGENTRRWNDRTVNRVLAHLKTFTRWVNKYRHFPPGNPMAKIKLVAKNDPDGDSPFLNAAQLKDIKMLKKLFAAGANPFITFSGSGMIFRRKDDQRNSNLYK